MSPDVYVRCVLCLHRSETLGKVSQGLTLPEIEVSPAFSVREVFAVEARGGSI